MDMPRWTEKSRKEAVTGNSTSPTTRVGDCSSTVRKKRTKTQRAKNPLAADCCPDLTKILSDGDVRRAISYCQLRPTDLTFKVAIRDELTIDHILSDCAVKIVNKGVFSEHVRYSIKPVKKVILSDDVGFLDIIAEMVDEMEIPQ